MIHVALGTAHMLGLVEGRPLTEPRTAHFMNGGRCAFDCAYCTRARTSQSSEDYLCRVPWPSFEEEKVFDALGEHGDNFSRVCLQIVNSRNHIETTSRYLESIKDILDIPISIELRTRKFDVIKNFLNQGANYVGLPLDVASEKLFPTLRGGALKSDLDFLLEAARRFEGQVGTHLIVGLGETEAEMVQMMRVLARNDIQLGLFAFTPCRGTKMEKEDPPSLGNYRKIQLAKHLIASGKDEKLEFDSSGKIISFGLPEAEISKIPSEVFQTQGCFGCNRPYYNERPTERPYNYPRRLTEEEFERELQEAFR